MALENHGTLGSSKGVLQKRKNCGHLDYLVVQSRNRTWVRSRQLQVG